GLRSRILGMGVIHVEAGTVGEHGVDQGPLRVRHAVSLVTEATGIPTRRLLLVRPLDPDPGAGVGVHHHRRTEGRVELGIRADGDAVLGLGTYDLAQGHLTPTHRY